VAAFLREYAALAPCLKRMPHSIMAEVMARVVTIFE